MLSGLLVLSFPFFAFAVIRDANYKDSRNLYYQYDTVQPILFGPAAADSKDSDFDEGFKDKLIISFEAFNKPFVAELNKNKDLLSDGFFERTNGNDEVAMRRSELEKLAQCFYKGEIPGVKDSWVAVSICEGVSGSVFDGNDLYHIEPDYGYKSKNHYVYKASDVKPVNYTCGAIDTEAELDGNGGFGVFHNAIKDTSIYQAFNQRIEQLYVELLVVNDKAEYEKRNQDYAAVFYRNLDIVNVVNGLYTPLKIKFSLIGVIVWTDSDKIPITTNNVQLNSDFAKYRQNNLLTSRTNDVAVLFTGVTLDRGVLGSAYTGKVCNDDLGAGVISDHGGTIGYIGNTFAHEMGHSIGMRHDNDVNPCPCPVDYCIMFAIAGENTKWSDCSRAVVESLHQGSKPCLANKPTQAYN